MSNDESFLRFTILGCGSSSGVPRIGNDWGSCDPDNWKNRRRRASLLVERVSKAGTTVIVVDTGPDFREQVLSADVNCINGILYTHSHADHIHGIDDLRVLAINHKQKIDIYCDEPTSARLHEAFEYCFQTPKGGVYPPILHEVRIVATQKFSIDGPGGVIDVIPFLQTHGNITSLGFRFANVAYSSDISAIPDSSMKYLRGLEYWIVDALQYRPHPNHFNLDESLYWINELKPERALLTHMHTLLDYSIVSSNTPDNVEPAFDGFKFESRTG